MIPMFRSEWLKIRRSVIWLLVAVSPLIASMFGFMDSGVETGERFPWIEALMMMSILHAMLFLPLLTGIYAALVCRYEHAGGGWKTMLSLPVTRTRVYVVKFAVIMMMLAATQALFLLAVIFVGTLHGFSDPVPWKALLVSVAWGWIACLPLAALQLFVSVAFQSFAAPLAVNVVLTLPNILVVNSDTYAPYYPWAQPMLAMLPREAYGDGAFNTISAALPVVILISFLLFFITGWTYFSKKAV
ncbi:ABC transporter permease [Cohnella faecalis]|uniref:ABC transporter permease n=1 Tax=Cohnella faecalis TaxID=2315694 RepID=A0A398CV76_9BACL|nr:ABC transporter permease [Cohnella faecalis]RIE05189.1 hypothetical protein D3H35_02125 [Cohnella faecalis]